MFTVINTLWAHKTDGNSAQHHQWGRVTHICVSKLTIIGSDNSLVPRRHQAIISEPMLGYCWLDKLQWNLNRNLYIFTQCEMSPGNWRPFSIGLNVLKAMDFPFPPSQLSDCARRRWKSLRLLVLTKTKTDIGWMQPSHNTFKDVCAVISAGGRLVFMPFGGKQTKKYVW